MTSETLPVLPFSRPHISEEAIAAVGAVLRSGWITSGPKTQAFEAALSEWCGGRPVRCFNSGTCTMEIALRIAGIGPGDEVITTPISWVATANVILEVGATPVFVDIDPRSRNLDLDQVEAAITPRTKALLPVYLAGLPVDMGRLYDIARRHQLRVVEDAAQALGSHWDGQHIGAIGDMVSFSFQANKNLTTAEGGCLVLNNAEEARLAEKYRLQGVTRGGYDQIDCDVLGGKYNMTDVAAVIGLDQIGQLDAINAHRARLAQHYYDCFGADFTEKTGAVLPLPAFGQSNWHLFQLELPSHIERAAFMQRMLDEFKIFLGFHYAPIHLFSLYRARGFHAGMFPHAERYGRQNVSLPMFNTLDTAGVERTVAAIKQILCA
ncbi:DegT/DnrJ/EryC1/StrS aminotransferase family protein [Massilia sp. W12]|uniref:DegT/DnrJ/EryC1/StrS family aminotransferase n=1 Tax=Massilia sp. W12 TaxID=3126507 RepID=UPI0030CB23D0